MRKNKVPDDAGLTTAAFDQFPDPVFIKDEKFRYLLVNNAFCDHYQLKQVNIIGHTDRDFLPPELFKASRERERKVFKTGITEKIEQNHVAPSGICYRVQTLNTLFVTPDETRLIFGMIRDVTDRKQFSIKLKESEKKYRAIFQIIPNPVGIFTYPERIGLDVNNAFLKIAGMPRKSIIGKQGIHAFIWADQPERDRYFATLVREKKVDNMEISLYDKSGKLRNMTISARMVTIDGQTQVIAALQEVTLMKKLEHELISKVIEAEERERRRIATDLHDDLGPMLSSIKLQMEHMKSLRDPHVISEHIEANVSLLNDVISMMHSISMNLAPHLIDHYGLEAAVRDLCSRNVESTGTSIRFTSNLENKRQSPEVELHFYRIISELINNSLKYATGLPITIRLTHKGGLIRLVYFDGGIPYNIRKILRTSKGMGMQNIIRRVKHIGGTIDFYETRGRTEIRICCKTVLN